MISRDDLKKIGPAILITLILLAGPACDTRDNGHYPADFEAPPTPTGVTSTTMDEAILLSWDLIFLDPDYDDLDGYKVYRSLNNSVFEHIATVNHDVNEYLDEGLQNGRTYYYAVSSIDFDGNESDLSYATVYDTPRPEGFDVIIYSMTEPDYDHLSGFDLSSASRVSWDAISCDFYLEFDETPGIETYFLWLGDNGADIQDMGYTDSFDDITYAPESGWSSFQYVEAIVGHTYVIRTIGDNYAKVRITNFDSSPAYAVIFDWGYQVDGGNRELKIESPVRQNDGSENGSVQ